MHFPLPEPVKPATIYQSERLVLRPAWPAEAEAVAQYHGQNREFHQPWEPIRSPEYYTHAYWERILSQALEAWNNDAGYTLFLFTADSIPVGKVRLSNIVRGPFQACHLGYGLAQEAQGQGLMTLALRAVIDFAFGPLNLHRLMANYQTHNERSAKLLERLGFEREGLAPRYLFMNGAWCDHVLTSLINPRWSGPKES